MKLKKLKRRRNKDGFSLYAIEYDGSLVPCFSYVGLLLADYKWRVWSSIVLWNGWLLLNYNEEEQELISNSCLVLENIIYVGWKRFGSDSIFDVYWSLESLSFLVLYYDLKIICLLIGYIDLTAIRRLVDYYKIELFGKILIWILWHILWFYINLLFKWFWGIYRPHGKGTQLKKWRWFIKRLMNCWS